MSKGRFSWRPRGGACKGVEDDAQKEKGGGTGGGANSARNSVVAAPTHVEPGRKHMVFFFRGPASRCWKRKVEQQSSNLGGWLVSLFSGGAMDR